MNVAAGGSENPVRVPKTGTLQFQSVTRNSITSNKSVGDFILRFGTAYFSDAFGFALASKYLIEFGIWP